MSGLSGISALSGLYAEPSSGGGVSAPISGLHVYSEAGPDWNKQLSDGTGDVVVGDPVGFMLNAGDQGQPNWVQSTAGSRGTLGFDAGNSRHYIQMDGVDDFIQINDMDSFVTNYDVWVLCRTPTSNFRGISGFTSSTSYAQGFQYQNGQSLMWERRSDGQDLNASRAGSSGQFVALRGTAVGMNISFWISSLASAGTRTGLIGVLTAKNTFRLGSLFTQYGNSRIYAVALRANALLTNDEVATLKSDWTSKFGVTFAW